VSCYDEHNLYDGDSQYHDVDAVPTEWRHLQHRWHSVL
jgi:hypothetical protein